MAQIEQQHLNKRTTLKFVAPGGLKTDLMALAAERNISLSSLLRLITTEYVRRQSQT